QEAVPAALQPMLLGQRVGDFRQQILEKANHSRIQVEERCRQHQNNLAVWAKFTELIDLRNQAENRLAALQEELAKVASEVQNQSEAILGKRLVSLVKKKAADLEALHKSLEEVDQQLRQTEKEEAHLVGQLQDSSTQSKTSWWTLSWWKSTFAGKAT